MKINRVLLVLVLLVSMTLIAFQPFPEDGKIVEIDDRISSAPSPVTEGLERDQSYNPINFAGETVSLATANGMKTTKIDNHRLGEYNIVSWKSVSHLFPKMDYPDTAKVALSEDNKLRVMTLDNRYDLSKTELANSVSGLEFLDENIGGMTHSAISIAHLDLDKFNPQSLSFDLNHAIEPDFIIETDYTPNDPGVESQWAIPAMDLQNSWDVNRGNHSVKVAVLDTGIDYNHEDLADNYLSIGYDWVNDDNDPMDDQYHGTHVAGTIAATMNNGIGVAGVANVSVFAEKILDSSGSGAYSWGVSAMYHAVDQGADILSNSWGGGSFSQALQDAVNYAVDNGVIVIAAAGNDASSEPHYPAALDNVMSVSSIDSQLELSSFSNFGTTIDIAGPGSGINSTLPGNDYGTLSGTSMATPHVSGVAALYLSEFPNLSLNELENLMYISAQDLGETGYDTLFGYGLAMPDLSLAGLPSVDLNPRLIQEGYNPVTGERDFRAYITNFGSTSVESVEVVTYLDNQQIDYRTISQIDSVSTNNFTFTASDSLSSNTNLTIEILNHPSEDGVMPNTDTVLLRQIDILNEDEFSSQTGSLVFVDSMIEGFSEITSMEYYREGSKILEFAPYLENTEFFLPIVNNGTTNIQLKAAWRDGSFIELSFVIEATEVIPMVDLELGDVYDWIFVDGTFNQKQEFVVTSMPTPDTVNYTLNVVNIDDGVVSGSFSLWGIMNIYSLRFTQTNFGWDFLKFPLVSNLEKGDIRDGQAIAGFLDWHIPQYVQMFSRDGDQMIVSAHIPNTTAIFEYYAPQNVLKTESGPSSGYMNGSSELERTSQGLNITAESEYSYMDKDYLELNITNTGDYVEEIYSLELLVNGVESNYELYVNPIYDAQSNVSLLYPGITYNVMVNIQEVSNIVNMSLATITSAGNLHTYTFDGVIEITDNVSPLLSSETASSQTIDVGNATVFTVNVDERFSSQLRILVNGDLVIETEFDGNEYVYEFSSNTPGMYDILFEVIDTSGNMGSISFVVEVVGSNDNPDDDTTETTTTSDPVSSEESSEETELTDRNTGTDNTEPDISFDLNFPSLYLLVSIFGLIFIQRKKTINV